MLVHANVAGLALAALDALDERNLEQRVLGKRAESKRQHASSDLHIEYLAGAPRRRRPGRARL